MRLLREIPKIDPIKCDHLEDSWCLSNKCWCYKVTKCKTKTNMPEKKISKAHRPYTAAEYKTVDRLIMRGDTSDSQIMKLAKKFDRTKYAILKVIYHRRKLLKERGKICSES